ncbi:efflux RND transporter periplasmic adaptor subunit [Komagataeibacter sp. AV436]|uniref:Efflux RND transporter periplasmic adaptor subunit n=1 Tax=Komagataeibacter melomenusus TaxID=2766578 RepID=A0ABX2AAA9_9PROT|nr:efflux RND transporter periplasmic adaptor subunit [Komagataeibacter melomenusus]MBV1829818.1 efflux RND transporter periplasmic adaptor subunit [Komagataeibacter melomenusus]NPC65306.1 efflux RND transporter periplasmic adaptor subunit [Komagataeibacter melomenusus]
MQTRHTGSEGVGHGQPPSFLATIFHPVTPGEGSAPPERNIVPAAKKPGGSPGLILLCLLLLLSACHKKAAVEEVRPVRSVIVEPESDANGEVMTGQVAAHQSINLAFRLPGKVVERTVSAGSVVHAGDVLARLDDTVPQQALRTALAENATARAALEQATPLKQRAAALLPVEAISRNDYDDAVRRYKTAQDQVQATQAQVRVAQEQLGYTRLVAPEDGIVTNRLVEAGEVVAAGQPVLRMAADDGLDAQFDMPEALAQSRLAVGMTMKVCLDAAPATCAPAAIYEIAPDTDPLTRTYHTKALLRATRNMMPLGAVVTGRLSMPSAPTVHLPPAALSVQDGRPAVWIVAPDTLRVSQRAVTVARYGTDDVVIASGLNAGDRVVTAGVQALYPQEKVSLLDEADVRP